MINKIKLQKTVKNLGHKTSEHIQTIIDFANFVPNDELVKAKPSMSQEELIEKVFRQIYVPFYPVDKPIYEMTSYEQGLYKQVRIIAIAILAGISKKQEVLFDKEKTAILNELVNGTGKK